MTLTQPENRRVLVYHFPESNDHSKWIQTAEGIYVMPLFLHVVDNAGKFGVTHEEALTIAQEVTERSNDGLYALSSYREIDMVLRSSENALGRQQAIQCAIGEWTRNRLENNRLYAYIPNFKMTDEMNGFRLLDQRDNNGPVEYAITHIPQGFEHLNILPFESRMCVISEERMKRKPRYNMRLTYFDESATKRLRSMITESI